MDAHVILFFTERQSAVLDVSELRMCVRIGRIDTEIIVFRCRAVFFRVDLQADIIVV